MRLTELMFSSAFRPFAITGTVNTPAGGVLTCMGQTQARAEWKV